MKTEMNTEKRERGGGSMTTLRGLSIGLAIVFLAVNSTGQATSPAAINSQKASCDSQVRSTYLLGPEDELQLSLIHI